jgi:hypothetical protein
MRNVYLGLIVAVTLAIASVTAYHVEPRTAAMSGKVPGDPQYGGVSQEVVACFDTLERVELFAGAILNGGAYRVGVSVDGDEVMHSFGTQAQNESWVKFTDWDQQVAFTKGKELTIRFTRSGDDDCA